MKLLFLDTETTGLEPQKHAVIQISGIIEIDGEVKEEFDLKCSPFPGDMVTKEALEMHGLTIEQLKAYPEPQAIFRQFYTKLDQYHDRYNKADKFYMVGQNTKFDYEFMDRFFKKNGDTYWYARVFYHLIDLVSATALFKLAGKVDGIPNMKLETVAKHFGIEYTAHDSLADIRTTRKIFYKYVDMIKN